MLIIIFSNIFYIFSAFIEAKFRKRNERPDHQIYTYKTTATDTNLVKKVVDQIYQIILREMLEEFTWFLVTSLKVSKQIELLLIFWTSRMGRTLIYFQCVLVNFIRNTFYVQLVLTFEYKEERCSMFIIYSVKKIVILYWNCCLLINTHQLIYSNNLLPYILCTTMG